MVKGLAVFSMLGVAVAMTAGCQHSASSAPPLTGPSQLAMAVTVLANPDRLSLDGASQSLITVQVRGPNGQVEVNVPLRVDMVVTVSNGATPPVFAPSVQDYGTLNPRNVVTGPDGNASAIYTAPALAAGVNQPFPSVSIQVAIVGTNAVAAVTHSVAIALAPVGVILPPADTPTAAFVVTPTPVNQNVAASFDASGSCPGAKNAVGCLPSSSSVITNYAWTFGDGATANGKTVNHTYSAIGAFNATLTITNDRGIQNSTTQTIAVSATALPKAAFISSPSTPGINQAVTFNAGTSTPGLGRTIVSYNWNFGDGSNGSGILVTHAFGTAGIYSVTLTVTDDLGQSNPFTQTVTVSGLPTGGVFASFTVSPLAPTTNSMVNFNASSSTGPVVRYDWDFGDGVTARGLTVPTTTHRFTAVGGYLVLLTVSDAGGHTNAATQTVTVTVPTPPASPVPAITFSPAIPSLALGGVVKFDASTSTTPSGAPIILYRWNFGDGTIVSGAPAAPYVEGGTFQSPWHKYIATGTNTVTLTVTDTNGLSGSTPATVTVGP